MVAELLKEKLGKARHRQRAGGNPNMVKEQSAETGTEDLDTENLEKSMSARYKPENQYSDPHDILALRWHCIKNRHPSVIEIPAWPVAVLVPEWQLAHLSIIYKLLYLI